MGIFALGLSGATPSTLTTSDEVVSPSDSTGNTAWCAIPWTAVPGTSFRVRVVGSFETTGGTVRYRVRIGGTPSAGTTPDGTEVIAIDTTGSELINVESADITKPSNVSYLQFSVQRISGTTVNASVKSLIVEIVTDSASNGIILNWFPRIIVTTTSEVLSKEWVYNLSKLTSSTINVGYAGRSHGSVFVPTMVHNVRIGGTWNTVDGTVACTFNGIGYTLDGILGGAVSNITRPTGIQPIKATFQPGASYGSSFAHLSVIICDA
jgi:hypothetical protein